LLFSSFIRGSIEREWLTNKNGFLAFGNAFKVENTLKLEGNRFFEKHMSFENIQNILFCSFSQLMILLFFGCSVKN
jgi:hypothetical protein